MSTEAVVLCGNILAALLLAPLAWGLGGKVRDWFWARRGARIMQLYCDIYRELREPGAYSPAAPVFRGAAIAGFCSLVLAAGLMPAGGNASYLGFDGDIFLLAALLGARRFWLALGASDMVAPGNAPWGLMATPALFLTMAALAGGVTLTLHGIFAADAAHCFASRIMIVAALLLLYLAEFEGRESAMFKQGTAEDYYFGPEYGLILYAAALKAWLFGVILVLTAWPALSGLPLYFYWPALFAGVALLAVGGGALGAFLGRLSMLNRSRYLWISCGCALLALIFRLCG